MESFKFELGAKAKDVITGLEGIIVSRTQWLTNCNTYSIQQQDVKDGKIKDRLYFDEPQIQLVDDSKIKLNQPIEEARKTGGPTPMPQPTNR